MYNSAIPKTEVLVRNKSSRYMKWLLVAVCAAIAFSALDDAYAQSIYNKSQSASQSGNDSATIWNKKKAPKNSAVYSAPVKKLPVINQNKTKKKSSYTYSSSNQQSDKAKVKSKYKSSGAVNNVIDASKCGSSEYEIYKKYSNIERGMQNKAATLAQLDGEDYPDDSEKMNEAYVSHMGSILNNPQKSKKYFEVMVNCAERYGR